jgi:hypothetical protein
VYAITEHYRPCRDLSGRYKFTEKSNFDISFPWNRLFEIDVELKKDKKK